MEQMFGQCVEMMRIMGGNMMNGMMNDTMSGMMWPMMLGTLLFWTLAILAIVLLVRSLWSQAGSGKRTAMSILHDRFARGEIDLEEYQFRRGVLHDRY